MDDIRLFAGAVALAVVVAVWAIGSTFGDGLTKSKPLGASSGCTDEQHPEGGKA